MDHFNLARRINDGAHVYVNSLHRVAWYQWDYIYLYVQIGHLILCMHYTLRFPHASRHGCVSIPGVWMERRKRKSRGSGSRLRLEFGRHVPRADPRLFLHWLRGGKPHQADRAAAGRGIKTPPDGLDVGEARSV